MRNRDEKLFNEVCMPIYRELFKKATPSADFDELMKSGEDGFFDNYYLPNDTINEIIDKHIKDNTKKLHITKRDTERIRLTILLGCSPTGNNKKSKI